MLVEVASILSDAEKVILSDKFFMDLLTRFEKISVGENICEERSLVREVLEKFEISPKTRPKMIYGSDKSLYICMLQRQVGVSMLTPRGSVHNPCIEINGKLHQRKGLRLAS